MEQTAEFFREKAAQCRELAEGIPADSSAVRGLQAMALEFDACALAIEAGKATARQIDQPNEDAPTPSRPPN